MKLETMPEPDLDRGEEKQGQNVPLFELNNLLLPSAPLLSSFLASFRLTQSLHKPSH